MRDVSIVTLSRYQDMFNELAGSIERHDLGYRQIVVVDGTWEPREGWERIQGPKEFSMTGNRNLGWKAATGDILDVGDDVTFAGPMIERLQEVAYSDPSYGIVAPQIIGGTANPLQSRMNKCDKPFVTDLYIPLICTYIKREVIEKVGWMDEQFNLYSPDDVDYCLRAKQAGYKLVIDPTVVVHHNCTATFRRNSDPLSIHLEKMWRLFEQKWGHRNTA